MNSINYSARDPVAKHPSQDQARRGGVGLWLLGLLGGSVLITGLVVLNAVTLNSDARAMRAAMLEGFNARSTTRVQVSVGPTLLDAARLVLRFVDHVPAEARLALSAARGASVGVYALRESSPESGSRQAIASTDAAMTRRGWVRIVAVANRNETVLIYTPLKGSDREGELLRVCIGVCHDRELVVVSAKVDSAPLLELAGRHRGFVRL